MKTIPARQAGFVTIHVMLYHCVLKDNGLTKALAFKQQVASENRKLNASEMKQGNFQYHCLAIFQMVDIFLFTHLGYKNHYTHIMIKELLPRHFLIIVFIHKF